MENSNCCNHELVVENDLVVLKKYRAFIQGGEVDEGVFFEDQEFVFTVLPKPNRVLAETMDVHGLDVEEVELPEHLSQPFWYLIRKDGSKTTSWFNAKGVIIVEAPDIKKIELYREDNGQYSTSESVQDDLSGIYYQAADVDELVKNLREHIRELEDNK